MANLEHVTTDELFEELHNRCQTVMAIVVPYAQTNPEGEEQNITFKGSLRDLLYLHMSAYHELLNSADRSREEEEDEFDTEFGDDENSPCEDDGD